MSPTRSRLPIRLAVWLLVQLLVLLIGAVGLPLSAHPVEPPGALAVHQLLACQIGFASLTFPWLLAGAWQSAAIVLTSIPFLLMAAWLGMLQARPMILTVAHAVLWLSALAMLAAWLTKRSDRPWLSRVGVVIVSLWSIGGAVFFYLRLELLGQTNPSLFGPIISGMGVINSGYLKQSILTFLLLFIAAIVLRLPLRQRTH